MSALSTALQQQFGAARLVRGLSAGGVAFDDAAIDAAGLSRSAVYTAAAAFLRELEGVHSAYPQADLAGSAAPRPDQPHLAAMRLSYHPQRSAQVAVAPLEGWIFSSRQGGATHGSPWAYDQHVPILLWGPRWFGPAGAVDAPVQVVDIAPTLARVLRIPAPAQAQGSVLPRRAAQRSAAL